MNLAGGTDFNTRSEIPAEKLDERHNAADGAGFRPFLHCTLNEKYSVADPGMGRGLYTL